MSSRLRIYNRVGEPLAELEASCSRSYKINDVGKCDFTIGMDDPKNTPEIIKFRNLVYVTHDTLPGWGGYILTPQVADDISQTEKVTAHSGERLLRLRRSEGAVSIKGTPGDVFVKLIHLANRREDLNIRIGEIWSGGKSRGIPLGKTDSLMDEVKKLATQSGNDWSIDPAVDQNGKLYFLANWYAKRGSVQDTRLEQGVNIEASGSVRTIQGDLINDLMVKGNNEKSHRRQQEYIDRYGLIEGTASYSAESQPGTLAQVAEELVEREARGRRTYRVRTSNTDGLWSVMGIGNTYPFKLYRPATFVPARLLGMQTPDVPETLELTLDEVIE